MPLTNLHKTRKNLLAKVDVLGSFDFYTTIVSLESCENKDIQNILNGRDEYKRSIHNRERLSFSTYQSFSKVYPVATHEYTHFIDCTSTLWGMRYLEAMSNAYTADDRRFGGTESGFHHAKKFSDLIRFTRLPDYYTFRTSATDFSRPWKYQESIGNRFDNQGYISDKPILFITFTNAIDQKMVRAPISTLSVLECSAMAQEVQGKMSLIMMLGDERAVELTRYQEEMRQYLYNPDLTEYSVCAQLLAVKMQQPDIVEVFRACALICRLVLNTPTSVYEIIALNYDFTMLWGHHPQAIEFANKVKLGLKIHEPGILFYLLCQFIPHSTTFCDIEKTIINAYNKLGIPLTDLESIAKNDAASHAKTLSGSKVFHIRELSLSGHENFARIKWGRSAIQFHELNIPPVLLGDYTKADLMSGNSNRLQTYNIDALYDELVEGQLWVDRFTEACE
ncbi:hypothetical protein J7G18_000896 [Vibrio parahaemolyticus]|nr:hypothetical protein [Vibrio parahaemolyticus]EJE3285962.1 hypothetical protein [Vibrio alginolyticus]